MKNTTISLLLVLFVSACSHKTESIVTTDSGVATNTPQFSVVAGDVVSASVETVTGHTPSSPTRAESMVHIELSGEKGAEFRKFTKDHVGQQVQILVGTKVVQEPMIAAEIVSPKIDLLYSTPAEAQSIADLLSKK